MAIVGNTSMHTFELTPAPRVRGLKQKRFRVQGRKPVRKSRKSCMNRPAADSIQSLINVFKHAYIQHARHTVEEPAEICCCKIGCLKAVVYRR